MYVLMFRIWQEAYCIVVIVFEAIIVIVQQCYNFQHPIVNLFHVLYRCLVCLFLELGTNSPVILAVHKLFVPLSSM
jgi:hypothetical protein